LAVHCVQHGARAHLHRRAFVLVARHHGTVALAERRRNERRQLGADEFLRGMAQQRTHRGVCIDDALLRIDHEHRVGKDVQQVVEGGDVGLVGLHHGRRGACVSNKLCCL
jgi:hypothetical protein